MINKQFHSSIFFETVSEPKNLAWYERNRFSKKQRKGGVTDSGFSLPVVDVVVDAEFSFFFISPSCSCGLVGFSSLVFSALLLSSLLFPMSVLEFSLFAPPRSLAWSHCPQKDSCFFFLSCLCYPWPRVSPSIVFFFLSLFSRSLLLLCSSI